MAKKVKADLSTEEKIKEAARKVFMKKGYSATRTRDIAEEAGMNLALLNYYFRSKEKLFDIVMLESLQQFLQGMKSVLNNEQLSLSDKINSIVENYINLLKTHADLPLFILSEIKANPKKLAVNIGLKDILLKSHFHKQITETTHGKIKPLHIYMNVFGLVVFPFASAPMLKIIGDLKQSDFDTLMEERKKLIPLWINSMLKLK